MKPSHVRHWVALCLTVTVCLSILGTLTAWAIRGPDSVPEVARDKMMELISFIVGIVAGYLMKDGPDEAAP